MAKIVENEKGLKVLKIGYGEMIALTGNPLPVCDNCLKNDVSQGYYIAVLNMWYCPKCYKKFMETARRFEEDSVVEDRHYNFYLEMLKKANMLEVKNG